MLIWLAVLTGLPALAGAVLLLAGGRLPDGWVRIVAAVVIFAAVCSALALLPGDPDEAQAFITDEAQAFIVGEARLDLGMEWLPGLGRLSLDLSFTAVSALAVTLGAMGLALVAAWPDRPSRFATGILLFSLPAAALAFLAGHWLLRYIALEAVALVAVLTVAQVSRDKTRWGLIVYLLLRVGDAGLLAAILALSAAGGTLDIARSLEIALRLGAPQLGPIAAGLLLAVWVKLGGWPFHAWMQAGRRSPLLTQTWLPAILIPNLALYLLYRATPLLPLVPCVQQVALWVGAGGAVLAAAFALVQPDRRTGVLYVVTAVGALALLASAAGKTAVWLSLLATTPLRLLLHLNCASRAHVRFRRIALALGGAALAAWSMLVVSWAREAGAPYAACLAGEGVAGLIGAWTIRALWQQKDPAARAGRARHWAPATVVLAVGMGVVGSTAALRPLLHSLVEAGHGVLAGVQSLSGLGRSVIRAPVFWITMPVGAAFALRLQRERPDRENVVQDQEQTILALARGVVSAAGAAHRLLERGRLEGRLARGVACIAGSAYRSLERGRLESLPARVGHAALALGRRASGWQSGRLRRRLLWLVAALVVAVLAVLLGESV